MTRGAISVKEALALGAALALLAFGLVLTTNLATVAWSFAALLVAVLYPYAKRVVSMPQAVLGIAFSFGIPMAFAAVRGGPPWQLLRPDVAAAVDVSAWLHSVPALAWLLLFGNLFWVLAYDTEYAMVDRDDDLKIGIKTSAITLGRFDVAAIMLSYGVFLAIWVMALRDHVSGVAFWAGVAAAAGQACWHGWLIHDRTRDGCFKAFRLNHWVGFAVFAGIALGDALR